MDKKIYLDFASTTPILEEVAEYMYKIMKQDFGNPSSIHHYGRHAKAIVEESRATIATYLRASVGEIFFTSGATESFHTVVYAALEDLGVKHIVSCNTEHHATIHTLEEIKNKKLAEVTLLKADQQGHIEYDELAQLIETSDTPTLVCMMHGNNEIATKHDIQKIGEICDKEKVYFLCDVAQTFGKYPLDLQELNISFMIASAHKLFGPKGIGLLYVNDDNQISSLFKGGSQERNMRAGTECVHGIGGFAKATELAVQEMTERKEILQNRKSYLINTLSTELEDIQFNGDIESDTSMSHVLSVSFPNTAKSELLMMNLDIAGICASSGSACASGAETDSHVLQAIGHDPDRKTIRFSFSHTTTEDELNYLIQTLKKVL